jgi:hypothetical protein
MAYAELSELALESFTGVKGVEVKAARLFVGDDAPAVEPGDKHRVRSGLHCVLTDYGPGDNVVRLKRRRGTSQDVPSWTIAHRIPLELMKQ